MKRREFIKDILFTGAGLSLGIKSLAEDKPKSLFDILKSPNLSGAETLHSSAFKNASQKNAPIDVNKLQQELSGGPVLLCFGVEECTQFCTQIHTALGNLAKNAKAPDKLTILAINAVPGVDNRPAIQGGHPEWFLSGYFDNPPDLPGVPANTRVISIFPKSNEKAKSIQLDDCHLIGNRSDFYAHSAEILLFNGKTGNFIAKQNATGDISKLMEQLQQQLKSPSR